MSRTIIDVLIKIGHAVELSSLEETRGIFIYRKLITLNGKLFEGTGIDVSGSVFYKCTLATDCVEGACLIDCSTNVGVSVPKDFAEECIYSNVSLIDVDFLKADIQGIGLRYTNLQGANLQGANLQGANLQDTNLEGVDLRDVDLRDADLKHANLQGANLEGANLEGADLFRANLQGANLQSANLQSARLRFANLQGANLQGANLQGANLLYVNLQGAYYDNSTSGLLEEHKAVMNCYSDDEYDDEGED